MFSQRGVRLLAAIILVVTLPSAAALAWYYYTNDPTLRPLGITEATIAEHDGVERIEIVARLDWDQKADGQTSDSFASKITRAFHAKGVLVRVVVNASNGQGTYVTYDVGVSHIGPFPKANAVNGVNAAVAAYRMNVPYSEDPVANQ